MEFAGTGNEGLNDDLLDEIWDVDGAGTTGFVSNQSNRAY
jgi:hypothetical protein